MAKRGLARLKAQHPLCCFCGGARETTSEDHQPARVFFRSKRMPDGFAFPACDRCQNASRKAEAALSLLIVPRDAQEEDRAGLRKRAAYFHRNDPSLIEDLWPSQQEKLGLMKQLGLRPRDGFTEEDIPLIKLEIERWKPHLDIVALKLILALHYRYIGRPLSRRGLVIPSYVFNAQVGDGELLQMFQEAAQNLENPRHGNEDLGDQIQVRWSVDVEHGAGVFLVHLHGMIFVMGVTADDPEWARVLASEDAEDARSPLD